MKNPFSKSHLAIAVASVAVCGATFAAVSPLVLPWQGMSPKVDQHDQVLAGVGTFEGTLTMFMPGLPEPMKVPCTETVTAIGELWTTSRFETTFMGMPFTGSSTFGYDASKEKFVGTWVDSTNTSLTNMEGVFDEKKNAIVMDYEAFDPPSGKYKKMRSEFVQNDEGYVLTFFNMDGNTAGLKQMEMSMQRKAEAMDAKAPKEGKDE